MDIVDIRVCSHVEQICTVIVVWGAGALYATFQPTARVTYLGTHECPDATTVHPRLEFTVLRCWSTGSWLYGRFKESKGTKFHDHDVSTESGWM
jgi:hypothetical protein